MKRSEGKERRHLSPRQRAIVALLAAGRTQLEAAAELGISVRTVEMHLSRARHRVGAATTYALVSRARARGLGSNGATDRDSTDRDSHI